VRRRPRRPPPQGAAPGDQRAAAHLEARLVAEESGPLGLRRLSEQTFLGPFRRQPAPWSVEIVDRATGRLVAVEPVDGTRSHALGVFHVIRADLESMDIRRFMRTWGRRPR
jgi:hypothetical protein